MSKQNSDPYFLTPDPSHSNQPLLIFLPGMDETGRSLLYLETRDLQAAFDIRCLVIPPDDITDWEILTTQTIALIQAELEKTAQTKIYLCGESFGGCLALKLIERIPHLLEALILINPASSFHRVPWLRQSSRLLDSLPSLLYKLSPIVILPLITTVSRVPRARLRVLWKAAQAAPRKTAANRAALLITFQSNESLIRQFTSPVLLISSNGDRLLPSVEEAQRLSKIFLNAQVVILPHSGHSCLVEAGVNLHKILQAEHFFPLS